MAMNMANNDRLQQAEHRFLAAVGLKAESRELVLARSGVTIRALVAGEGPPAVFIHGGSTAGASWAHLAAKLTDFQCILIDRPGCGLSEMYDEMPSTIEDKRRNADNLLVDVVDALGYDRTHLVSTSLGGWFGFRGAAANPERVDRMVAIGFQIGAPVPRVPIWMRYQPPAALMPRRIWVNRFLMRKALEAFGLKAAFASGELSRSNDMLDWMVAAMNTTRMSWNELTTAPFPIDHEDTLHSAELLARITAPVHFFWGEDDPWAGEPSARKMMESLPGSTLQMVPNAGHAPWLDVLDDTATAVRAHLLG